MARSKIDKYRKTNQGRLAGLCVGICLSFCLPIIRRTFCSAGYRGLSVIISYTISANDHTSLCIPRWPWPSAVSQCARNTPRVPWLSECAGRNVPDAARYARYLPLAGCFSDVENCSDVCDRVGKLAYYIYAIYYSRPDY
jgi:hypothetical protein